MKTLATMTAIAALVAGMSVASAQNPAKPQTGSTSPANLNAAPTDTKQTGATGQSGMQTPGAAAVKGSGTVKTDTQAGSVSPAAPNAAASGEAQVGKSGMQPKSTQTQSGGSMTTPQTTGSSDTAAQSPADPNAKPSTSVK